MTSSHTTSGCPACDAGAEKTRDGRHHPGFKGKRFYSCRARDERPNYVAMRTQAEVDAFEEAAIDARIAESLSDEKDVTP